MRYYVTLAGRTVEVDLSGEQPIVDGRPVAAELRELDGTAVRHLIADGRSCTMEVRQGDGRGEWDVHTDGRRYAVEVVDERTRAIREMTGASASQQGPRPVRAPMPGLVVRVEVVEGDNVSPGQGLVIVEAMKMENELKAEAGGVVSRVHVSAGQAVEKGTVLVEFAVD